jgi:hypothetical protein
MSQAQPSKKKKWLYAIWFQQQPKEFYAAGFQGLVKHWGKCLNVQEDYVEK